MLIVLLLPHSRVHHGGPKLSKSKASRHIDSNNATSTTSVTCDVIEDNVPTASTVNSIEQAQITKSEATENAGHSSDLEQCASAARVRIYDWKNKIRTGNKLDITADAKPQKEQHQNIIKKGNGKFDPVKKGGVGNGAATQKADTCFEKVKDVKVS